MKCQNCKKRESIGYFHKKQVCTPCYNKLRKSRGVVGNPNFLDRLYQKMKNYHQNALKCEFRVKEK